MKEIHSRMVSLYKEWNEKINVISRKDVDNIYEHHIQHSLAIAEYLRREVPGEFAPGSKVLDLGTGGGFPGIPLAAEFPEVHFTLCDSIGKKIKVASSVAESLGLKNVTCVNCRAEELTEKFDWVVSRAVTSLDKFYPWVKGKYTKGILYLKGGDINEEISLLAARCKVDPASVSAWRIDQWLTDDYFAEKFVIDIRKNYLCTPKLNNIK